MYLTWIISKWREEAEWEGIIFPLQFFSAFSHFIFLIKLIYLSHAKNVLWGTFLWLLTTFFDFPPQQVGLPTGFCRIILPKLAKKQDFFCTRCPNKFGFFTINTNFSSWAKLILWKISSCLLKIRDIADFRLSLVSSSECRI